MSWASIAAPSKGKQTPPQVVKSSAPQKRGTQSPAGPQQTEKIVPQLTASSAPAISFSQPHKEKQDSTLQQRQLVSQPQKSSWAALAAKKPATDLANPAPSATAIQKTEPKQTTKPVQSSLLSASSSSSPPTREEASGWSSLPKDIISHHLLSHIEHASTIRVLRSLSRYWHRAIPLPVLNLPSNREFPADMCKLARQCQSVILDFYRVAPSNSFLEALSHNTALKRFKLGYWAKAWNAAQHDMLAKCFKRFQKVETIELFISEIPDTLLESIFDAVMSTSTPNLHTIVLRSKKCYKHLIKVAQAKKIRHLRISCDVGMKEQVDLFASWLREPTCSLESLALVNTPTYEADLSWFPVLLAAIKKNSTLRKLRLDSYFKFNAEIIDTVARHPTIRDLHVRFGSRGCFEPFLKMLLSTRFERLETDFAPEFDDFTPENIKLLCDVLVQNRLPQPYCWLQALLPDTDPGPAQDELLGAIAKNQSIEKLNYDGFGYRTVLLNHFISKSRGLKTLLLEHIGHFEEDAITALGNSIGKSKTLEHLQLDSYQEQKPSWKKQLFLGLKPLRSLRSLSLRRVIDDSVVTLLVALIQKNGHLSKLDLEYCSLSFTSMASIFQAAAKTGSLREISFYECGDLTGPVSSPLNPAIAALLQNCKLEILNVRHTKFDAAAINTIVSTVSAMDTCSLRKLEFYEASISSQTQKNLEKLVMQKAGLISLS